MGLKESIASVPEEGLLKSNHMILEHGSFYSGLGIERALLKRAILFVIFLLALYFPSSISGIINTGMQMLGYGLCLLLCAVYTALNRMAIIYANGLVGIFLMFLLLFSTVVSYLIGIGDPTFGALMPYFGLIAVLSLDLRSARMKSAYRSFFLVALTGLLVMAWGVISDESRIINFQSSWYQAFYESLFEGLVTWYSKPVTVFATHSFAAFVYFLIALVCYELYSAPISRISRLLCLMYFLAFSALIPMLLSTSAFFLTALLLSYLGTKLYWRHGGFALIATLIAIAMGFLAVLLLDGAINFQSLSELYQNFSTEGSGFSARFGPENRQFETYKFMFGEFNFPIGLVYNERLVLGDNFLAEYVVRISFIGYAAILVMLYNYLRVNMRSRFHRALILLIVILSDLGYPLLVQFRFVFLLPFIVVLLNDLDARDPIPRK